MRIGNRCSPNGSSDASSSTIQLSIRGIGSVRGGSEDRGAEHMQALSHSVLTMPAAADAPSTLRVGTRNPQQRPPTRGRDRDGTDVPGSRSNQRGAP